MQSLAAEMKIAKFILHSILEKLFSSQYLISILKTGQRCANDDKMAYTS